MYLSDCVILIFSIPLANKVMYNLWQATPSHAVWWCESRFLSLLLQALHLLAWLSVCCSVFTLDYLELLGIKQVCGEGEREVVCVAIVILCAWFCWLQMYMYGKGRRPFKCTGNGKLQIYLKEHLKRSRVLQISAS